MTISTVLVEIARRDAGKSGGVVVLQAIGAPYPRAQAFQVIANDLLIRGKDEGLVAGERKVAFDEVGPVTRIKPTEGSVYGGRQWPAGCLCESPEQGNAEQLTFPCGEIFGTEGLAVPSIQFKRESLRVDGKARD